MESRKDTNPDPETFRALTDNQYNPFLWGTVKAPKTYSDAAAAAADNAQTAAIATAPWITLSGISMLTAKGDYIGPILNVIGIPFTVGGVVIDAVKAPVCLAVASEEAVRAGILKLGSLVLDQDPNEVEMKEIFNSFLLRMRETATILIVLGLEDEDVLNRKLKSGDIEDLIGLTLLNTAYQSRYHTGLLLASKKTLWAGDCPPRGKPLFTTIMALKEKINSALGSPHHLSGDEREREDARTVCEWINDIKKGRPLSKADRPDATEHQLAVVNDIIREIESLKRLAMATLPVSPESAARSMPGLSRR